MRTPHLAYRGLNASPIIGLKRVVLLLAFGRLLRGLHLSLVAMRFQQTPRIVVDLVHIHGPSSSADSSMVRVQILWSAESTSAAAFGSGRARRDLLDGLGRAAGMRPGDTMGMGEDLEAILAGNGHQRHSAGFRHAQRKGGGG